MCECAVVRTYSSENAPVATMNKRSKKKKEVANAIVNVLEGELMSYLFKHSHDEQPVSASVRITCVRASKRFARAISISLHFDPTRTIA